MIARLSGRSARCYSFDSCSFKLMVLGTPRIERMRRISFGGFGCSFFPNDDLGDCFPDWPEVEFRKLCTEEPADMHRCLHLQGLRDRWLHAQMDDRERLDGAIRDLYDSDYGPTVAPRNHSPKGSQK